MATADLCELAAALERHLGDPHDAEAPMSYAKVLELDEGERYPYEMVALARRADVHKYMIPAAYGGKAVNVEDGFQLVRLIARRDPTTATAMVLTTFGFMPVWMAGDEQQRARLAQELLHGMTLAWGLTERTHGSDVLANEMRAERVTGGYLLSGEKWLIGNATVADGVMVFARTGSRGGPAGFSIFFVEKRKLPAGVVEPLSDEHLHGLRGLDMSGIRLHDALLGDEARIGPEGAGLEIALKSSQLARATITSVALGCTDTAVRLAVDFARRREIFGTAVMDIPYSRRQLAECLADLLIADAVSAGAVRSLQAAPEQASLFSSVAKFFVPPLLERTIAQAGVVLGARHYLRAHGRYGIFQKLARDVGVTGFADGNTVVNLKNIALALQALLDNALDAPERLRGEATIRARTLYGLGAELPPYRPWEQELFGRGLDDAVLALPGSLELLRARAGAADGSRARWLDTAVDLGERLLGQLSRQREEHRSLRSELGRDFSKSAELFELAKQYCAVHAAAACVHMAVHSLNEIGHLEPVEPVLALCLERLWQRFAPVERLCGADVADRVADVLEELHKRGQLLSFYPLPVADWPVDPLPIDARAGSRP